MRQIKKGISLLIAVALFISYIGMNAVTVQADNNGMYRTYETCGNIIFNQKKLGYILNENDNKEIKNDKKITVEQVVRGNQHSSSHSIEKDDPIILKIIPNDGYEIDVDKTKIDGDKQYISLDGDTITINPPDIREVDNEWPDSETFEANILIFFKKSSDPIGDNKQIILKDDEYTVYYNVGDNPKCIYDDDLKKEFFDALVDVDNSYSEIAKQFDNVTIEYVSSKPDNPEQSWKWLAIGGDVQQGSRHQFGTMYDYEIIRFVYDDGTTKLTSEPAKIYFEVKKDNPTSSIVLNEVSDEDGILWYEKGKMPRIEIDDDLKQHLYETFVDYEASGLDEDFSKSGLYIEYIANETGLTKISEAWEKLGYIPPQLATHLHQFSGKDINSKEPEQEVIRFVGGEGSQKVFSRTINITLKEIEKTIVLKDNTYTIEYRNKDKSDVKVDDTFYQKLYLALVNLNDSSPNLVDEISKSPITIEYSANYEGVDLLEDNDWQSLDHKPDISSSQHAFKEKGKELIRFVYKDNHHYYSENVVLSFKKIGKEESSVVLDKEREMAIPYTKNSNYLNQFLFDCIDFDASVLPEDIINTPTPEDFKFEYQYDLFANLLKNGFNDSKLESMNLSKVWVDASETLTIGDLLKQNPLLNAVIGRFVSKEIKALPVVPDLGKTNVRITYSGNSEYEAFQCDDVVNVYKAIGSIHVSSKTIEYGTPIPKGMITTRNKSVNVEERMKYISLYTGISGDGKGYFSIKLPQGYERLERSLQNLLGKESNLQSIIDKSKDIQKLFEKYGLKFPGEQILESVNAISKTEKLTIEIGKQPSKAGIYNVIAIVVENNYTTKTGKGMPMDVGTLTIVPKTKDVELRFKNNSISKISINEAKQLLQDEVNGFGGKATSKDGQTVYKDANIKTLYVGLTGVNKNKTSETPFVEAGTYKETVYLSKGNYAAKSISRCYTIEKETVTLKFDKPFDDYCSFVFNGKKVNPQAQAYDQNGNKIDGANIKYVYEQKISPHVYVPISSAPSAVGSYRVYAVYQGHDEYKKCTISQEFEIVKGEVNINVENIETTYNGQKHVPNVSIDKEHVRYTITYFDSHLKPLTSAPKDAGNYVFVVKVFSTSTTNGTSKTGTIKIKKATAKLNIENVTKVYGEKDPKFKYSIEGLYGKDDLGKITLKRTAGETVGKYKITAKPIEHKNYNVVVDDGYLTIKKAKVTIKVNDATKTYGDKDPKFTYKVEGLKKPLDLGRIYLTREKGENVGQYKIDAHYSKNKNYDVTLKKGTLTINKAKATIRVNDATKTYGDKDPKFTYEVEGLKKPLDLGHITLTREKGEDAGRYKIKAYYQQNKNYDVALENGTLTIQKAKAKLIVQSTSKIYGQKDPKFKYTVVGMKNKDSLKNVQVTRKNTFEDAGVYKLSATYDNNKNYDVSIVSGVLVIKQRTAVVVIDKKEKIYDQDDPMLTYKTYGLVKGDTLEDIKLSRETGEDVGTYKITAEYPHYKNYKVRVISNVLEIRPKEVIIDIWDTSKTYGEKDPEFTFEVNGYNDDNLIEDITLSRDTGEDVGEYQIKAEYTQNPNYDVKVNEGTLAIKKAQISIDVTNAVNNQIECNYGDNVCPEVVLGPDFEIFDDQQIDYQITYFDTSGNEVDDIETAGEYRYIIEVKDTSNYIGALYEGTITVLPKEIDVYIYDNAKTVGDADPEPILLVVGLDEGIDLFDIIEIRRVAGESIGKYNYDAVSLTPNYLLTVYSGFLDIHGGDDSYVPTEVPPKNNNGSNQNQSNDKNEKTAEQLRKEALLAKQRAEAQKAKDANNSKNAKANVQTDDVTMVFPYIAMLFVTTILMFVVAKKEE